MNKENAGLNIENFKAALAHETREEVKDALRENLNDVEAFAKE